MRAAVQDLPYKGAARKVDVPKVTSDWPPCSEGFSGWSSTYQDQASADNLYARSYDEALSDSTEGGTVVFAYY